MAESKGKKTGESAPRRRGSAFDVADDVPDTAPAVRTRPRLAPAPPSRPARQAPEGKAAKTSAFTWRRTPRQVIKMDQLTTRLKLELETGRLDHAKILEALVDLADENGTVFRALVDRLAEVLAETDA